MKEDSTWIAWQAKSSWLYDQAYYKKGTIVSRVNEAGHRMVEAPFGPESFFSSVLEVGAGTGRHFQHVRHRFHQYFMTDRSTKFLEVARSRFQDREGLKFEIADATKLNYPDASFDRVISTYNLEHLPNPHLVLQEWSRILKPGGILSIAIPLDGGVAWRLGRYLTTRRAFAREGLNLDYIIAREHINPSYNLISIIRHYFNEQKEAWYPFGFPSIDINLVYCCTLQNNIRT